jgi:hypothetical protein
MANNCCMDRINMGRVQGWAVGYAGNIILVYHWAPYDSLHLNDASLSELQFDVVYAYVFVCHFMLVTRMFYGPLMLYGVANFLVYGLCICVWLIYVCVPQCMNYVLDNMWCSNSKNLCVLMFLPILYGVFHPFLSMLPIVHVQSDNTLIFTWTRGSLNIKDQTGRSGHRG